MRLSKSGTLPRRALFGVAFWAVLALASGARAADAVAVLTRLFESPTAPAELFSPAFLARIPIAQINTVVGSIKQQYGTFRNVTETEAAYVIRLSKGEVLASVILDDKGQIASLLIHPKEPDDQR